MTSGDHERAAQAKAIFLDVRDLSPAERGARLDAACAGDEALWRAVAALLAAEHEAERGFLRSRIGDDRDRLALTGDLRMPSEFAVPIEAEIGSRIGAYRLLQRIGEGGFGSVFMAEQEQPVRRKVALKIIKLGMDTRQVVARFEQERQALALMDHPGIAKVFDAGATESGRPYFVMELCAGEPVTLYCDRNSLSVQERLELFIQVCNAVQHAHQKGIIHRDLKPSNILVATQDGRPLAKVIDFGIAKATTSPLTDKTLFTELRQLVGTPEYMSPEQAEGSLDIDTRTDVYSLGVLLYELITGSTPFDATRLRSASYAEIQRIIREVEPPKPSTRLLESAASIASIAARRRIEPRVLGTMVRGELDWIAMKALDKDRARRYASASEFAADVRRHLDGEPVAAAPPSTVYRFRAFLRRRRGLVAAACAVASVLLLGTIGTGVGLWRAERQRAIAEEALGESDAVLLFLADMLAAASPEGMGRDVPMRVVLDEASATIGERFRGRLRAEAFLRRTIANAYRALGEYEAAAAHLSTALALRRETDGPSAVSTIRAVGDLAGLRHTQGRFDESIRLGREALDAWRGEANDPVVLGLKNNLAQSLLRAGRHGDAIAMQREVVAGMAAELGASHEHTLGATVNLVSQMVMLGERDAAEETLLKVAETWAREHGPDRPGALFALSELGGFYINERRPAEAEGVLRELVARQERVLGPAHASTARTLANLGHAVVAQGRREEGRDLLERSWRAMGASVGLGHVDTLTIGAEVLAHYRPEEWTDETSERLGGIVESLRETARRSDASPKLLNDSAWHLLESPLPAVRDPQLALIAARRACDAARNGGDPELWSYLDTLALAHSRNGAPDAALETQREALRLLPAADERYRGEMEERLREYEQAAATR